MQCPSCGHENLNDAKFCGDCGATLAVDLSCPGCGAAYGSGQKFCYECGTPLEVAATATETAIGAPQSRPLPAFFKDGRYVVKEFLGEGGTKKVYLVNDTLLDRDVAFALVKMEGLDDVGRQRIMREAKIMGRLGEHTNVVQLYDLGEEAGQPYMVQPVMAGGSVEILIRESSDHGLPIEQAVGIAKEVCRGLEFAHSQGVVHRDLKPGNVWIASDGTAKIGDFGLAQSLGLSRLTAEDKVVGTPFYMAPEQAMGGEVAELSDLYSLGCMFYEMVTGRPPFVGGDQVAILGQHLNTPPVSPTWHNPEVPPGLESLIIRLLEKDPASRPSSAAEVLQSLEAIDLGSPPEAPSDAAPAGPDPTYGRTFVGREAELRQLHKAFDTAMSGEGSLFMVVGEPGIGKTTICDQLATYAKLRGGTTLVGHCYEEGSLSLPYLAFVEAMRSYVLDRDADGLRSDLGSGASEVARIVSEVRDRLDVEPSDPGDPEQDRYRLMQSVTSFLTNAATVQPLVIVLEDLHDADNGTLDMLTYVSRNLSGARLMIVGTYRDVEVDRSHPLSSALAELRRVANFDRIGLRGLTADEVQRMMTAISGHDVPSGTSEAVYRQTEGNPLFVQEVLRYLVEEGVLVREDGRPARQTPPEMRIPEGLVDVIGKRLSRLSSEANSVLSTAAVIGREFRFDVLEKVAGLSEDDLFAALEEAQGAAVVEEQTSAGAGVSFRFAHAFFRQTLYDETFTPRRIRLHQQVGQALESVHSARLEEHAAELTEHFAQSTERDDLQKALSYGEMASDRAMSVYAYGEAARLLEQALEVQEVLDPGDKAKRCDLLLALGEVLMPAGESLRAYEDVAPEAFGLAESLDDNDRVSRICELAVEAAQRASGGSLAHEPEFPIWAERADRSAAPGTRNRVLADLAMSIVLGMSGDDSGMWTLRQRALKLARQLSDREVFLQAAGFIIRAPLAPQHQEERLALAREVGDRYRDSLWTPLSIMGPPLPHWLAWAYLEMGERDRAEELWGEVKERATRTEDANLLMYALQTEVMVATLDGCLEDAVATAERLGDRGEELGIPVVGGFAEAGGSFYPSLYLGGRTEHLLASYEEWAQALILAHAGRAGEALELSRRNMKERADGEDTDETPQSIFALRAEHSRAGGRPRDRGGPVSDANPPRRYCAPRLGAHVPFQLHISTPRRGGRAARRPSVGQNALRQGPGADGQD